MSRHRDEISTALPNCCSTSTQVRFMSNLLRAEATVLYDRVGVQQYILQPLGLTSTFYSLPPAGQAATGYTNNGAGLVPAILWDRSAAIAAGALSSNVYNLVAWDNALTHGKVVSAASFKAMTTSTGFQSRRRFVWFWTRPLDFRQSSNNLA